MKDSGPGHTAVLATVSGSPMQKQGNGDTVKKLVPFLPKLLL